MAKTNGSRFECGECGWGSAKWLGRCGGCGSWDSLTVVATGGLDDRRVRAAAGVVAPPQAICDVAAATAEAWATGVEELDRVLGGGIVPGSAVLVGGEPGVGKSTLLLDVAARAAAAGRRVLYVSGEESVAQVAARGRRIGASHPGLKLGAVNELTAVKALIASERPELLIVDSIQTVVAPELDGTPGGVTHLRAVTSTLVTAAKACDMACLLVGHVTKDGSVAGPRTLEHLVDAVLLFEGDRNSALRWLRATKNRFGSAEEVGCFEMEEDGVKGVNDPSGLFLEEAAGTIPGSATAITLEGRRPLAVGIQSLVMRSQFGAPRRTVSGLDGARLAMVLAVLERRNQLRLSDKDVYVSTLGGLRCLDPALDLAVALACVSALFDLITPPGMVALGELGLGGQVRPVKGVGKRLMEAHRMGFERALVGPLTAQARAAVPAGFEVTEVSRLDQALRHIQVAQAGGRAADRANRHSGAGDGSQDRIGSDSSAGVLGSGELALSAGSVHPGEGRPSRQSR